jgi:hypothetical protein
LLRSRGDKSASNVRAVVPNICVREWGGDGPGTTFSADRRGECRYQPGDDHCKEGFGAALYGVGLTSVVPTVLRTCSCNEQAAIIGRVLRPVNWSGTNPAVSRATDRAVSKSWRALHRLMRGELSAHYWAPFASDRMWDGTDNLSIATFSPVPFDHWVARFPASQRPKFEKARDMATGEVTEAEKVYRAFVKVEKSIQFTSDSPEGKKVPDPRLIQGRSHPVKVRTGPTTLAMSKRLSIAWHPLSGGPVAYSSGHGAETVGQWFGHSTAAVGARGPCVYVEDDQSRWDCHVHPECQTSWNKDMRDVGAPGHAMEVLMDRRKKVGVARHGSVYTCRGEVASGDGDTSCGNSANHGKIKLLIGFEAGALDGEYRCIVNGDDGVTVLTRSALVRMGGTKGLTNKYASYGFEAVVSVRESPYEVQFCSGRFWPVGEDGWVWGPKIGRVLGKTMWSTTMYSDKKASQWLKGVVMGLRYDLAHIPVLRAIVGTLIKQLAGVKAMIIPKLEHKIHAVRGHECCPRSYEMMNCLYGISPDEVDALESWCALKSRELPTRLDHPWLEFIAKVDNS